MTISPYGEPITGELELFQPGQVNLHQWVQDASEVHRIAQVLANTSFVPAPLRGKPDEVAAQMLYGRDVNLPPMVALQQIHVIEGRPSLSALAMRGLAQANGVKFIVAEATSTRCVMRAKAAGDTGWTEVKWDIDRAKKLGVTGKRNWQNQPQAMLVARATSELCRLVAAPLFLGLSYSTEELVDGGEQVADYPFTQVQEAEQPKTRTIRRKKPDEPAGEQPTVAPYATRRQVAEAEPVRVTASFDNGPAAENTVVRDDVDMDGPVTDVTRADLVQAFSHNHINGRQTRLAYVSDLLHREVGSINEITESEGRQLLLALETDAQAGSGEEAA